MADLIREFKFSYFALTHHVLKVSKGVVRLHNYPDEWCEAIVRRKYFLIDPVHVISQRSAAGFYWSEYSRFMRLSDKQTRMQEEAKQAGIANGFTVPVNVPGEPSGSISLATRGGVDFPHESLPVVNFLAPLAFEAGKRIAGGFSPVNRANELHLTTRELDCVALVAQGKSDRDIGTILGVSAATARFHTDNARRKMNVATRTQMVIAAVMANQLTFADIVPHDRSTLSKSLGRRRE